MPGYNYYYLMPYFFFAFGVRFRRLKGDVVFISSNFPKLTTGNSLNHFISCAQNSLVELSISVTQSGWLSGMALLILIHIYLTMQLCFFLCVEVQRPSQQLFSHVGTEPTLPGYYQYFWGVKCLAQGHNTVEVGF